MIVLVGLFACAPEPPPVVPPPPIPAPPRPPALVLAAVGPARGVLPRFFVDGDPERPPELPADGWWLVGDQGPAVPARRIGLARWAPLPGCDAGEALEAVFEAELPDDERLFLAAVHGPEPRAVPLAVLDREAAEAAAVAVLAATAPDTAEQVCLDSSLRDGGWDVEVCTVVDLDAGEPAEADEPEELAPTETPIVVRGVRVTREGASVLGRSAGVLESRERLAGARDLDGDGAADRLLVGPCATRLELAGRAIVTPNECCGD